MFDQHYDTLEHDKNISRTGMLMTHSKVLLMERKNVSK